MNRLTGSNIDTRGRDSSGGVSSAKTWSSKDRSDGAKYNPFVHRKGVPSKPHMGLRSTNPSMAIHRAISGYQAEKKHNDNVGLPTPRFKSERLRSDIGSRIAAQCHDAARELRGVNNKITTPNLVEFVSTFMMNGLMYLQLSSTSKGDEIESTLIYNFAYKYGLFTPHRTKLLKSLDFWKKICKEVGAFLCPRNNVFLGNDKFPRVVHRIPVGSLRSASLARILALQRKGKPTMEKPSDFFPDDANPGEVKDKKKTFKTIKITQDNKLTGGGEYGYYSVLSGGGGSGNKYEGGRVNVSSKGVSRPSRAISGKGGKSKNPVKNNCEPKQPVGDCDDSAPASDKARPEPVRHRNYGFVDTTVSNFVGGGPNGLGHADCRFNHDEATLLVQSLRNGATRLGENYIDVDLFGAPFCGMTVIDTAARNKVDVKTYAARVGQQKDRDSKSDSFGRAYFTQNVINTVGNEDYLTAYASTRGLGVIFLVRRENQYFYHSRRNNQSGRYVVMVNCREDIQDGHWTIISKRHSDINHMYLEGDYTKPDLGCDYLGYGECIQFGQLLARQNNNDVRSYVHQRDAIMHQGVDQLVTVSKTFYVAGARFQIPFTSTSYKIDATRCHSVAKELAFSRSDQETEDIAAGLLMGREVNSLVDPVVVQHSVTVLRKLARKIKRKTQVANTRGLVCVNAPNAAAIIPNLDVIEANQNDERLQGGGRFATNHVEIPENRKDDISLTWRDVDPSKLNKPVAIAPIGAPVEQGKVVSCGLFSLTDEKGIMAAFAGRAMSKPEPDQNDTRSEFIRNSLAFITPYINNTPIDVIPEDFTLKGLIAQFRRTNEGNKSAKWIDRKVRSYIRYRFGLMSAKERKKYMRHGCFVKYESNIKRRGGKLKVRPRLIMTMSDLMQFELCYLSNISNVWYDGPIEQFQVKHMNPQSMIERIREAQDRTHCVTDYSAFESSITADIRFIENYVIVKLCERAGYSRTIATLKRLNLDIGRVLHTSSLRLVLNTRCSGDYWTSMGNGIIAICLMRFCHEKQMLDGVFSMISEGDDGLVPLETPDESLLGSLGFKFSTETSGTQPGDTDFLRSLWGHRRWLNIGRVISKIFWVKRASFLRPSKQKFLLRTMALSLHHLSPGHPILWAIVKHIETVTRGMNQFKSAALFLEGWKEWDLSGQFPEVHVDNSMRKKVSEGAEGFPPVPLTVQLIIERKLLRGDFNLCGLLNDFSDYKDHVDASNTDLIDWGQEDLARVYRIIGLPYTQDDLSSYLEFGVVRKPSRGFTGSTAVSSL